MSTDYDQLMRSIEYGKSLSPVIYGEDTATIKERMQGYPDHSDNSVLQWVFNTLDPISLDNEWAYNDTQAILDSWLLEELTIRQHWLDTKLQKNFSWICGNVLKHQGRVNLVSTLQTTKIGELTLVVKLLLDLISFVTYVR